MDLGRVFLGYLWESPRGGVLIVSVMDNNLHIGKNKRTRVAALSTMVKK